MKKMIESLCILSKLVKEKNEEILFTIRTQLGTLTGTFFAIKDNDVLLMSTKSSVIMIHIDTILQIEIPFDKNKLGFSIEKEIEKL